MNNSNHSESVRELLAALERDPRIDSHAYPIHVIEQDDRLVMEGTVANIAQENIEDLVNLLAILHTRRSHM